MRKFLFSAIALMISVTMLAVGTGDGKSQANAIDFDWDSAYVHEANTTLWYSVGLSSLSEEANNPTLALYLTNLTAEQANVTLSATAIINLPFIGALELSVPPTGDGTVNYNIAGNGYEIWTLPTTFDLTDYANSQPILKKVFNDPSNVSLAELREFGLDDVYLTLTSNKQIAIATKVYEQEEIIDDACTDAVAFDWTGETVAAGDKWFYLNLAEVKASNEKLNFVVENNGSAAANVAFDLYLDCPASAIVLDYDWTIPAGGQKSEALGRFLLNQISEDFVFLHLTTDQSVSLKAEKEVLPPPTPADNLFDATAAPTLGDKISLNNESKIIKVIVDSLKAPKGYKTVCHIVNHSAAPVNLKQEIAFEPIVTIHNSQVKNLTVAGDTKVDMPISNNTLKSIKSDVAYFRLTADGPMTIMFERVPVEAPATKPGIVAPACDESYLFDWNSTIKQKAFHTKWYELDITSLKQNEEQVHLTFTNHSDSMVVVLGSILLDCDSKDTIPYALPIPAGKSVSQLINYNLIAASLLEHAYLSVTVVPTSIDALSDITSVRNTEDVKDLLSFNTDAEVEITATKSSALVDPTLCNANETLQQGVKYTQAAGTTKWYRVTEEFIKNNLGLLSSLTIENQGNQAAHITLGATIACDYGVVSRATVTIPTWFDLTSIIPSGAYYLIDKLTNREITEFYLEVTTDQPIMFGFGVEYGNAFGCDNATDFDWATGTTIPANDAKWYKFDITDLKANEEQVKLTFTNTADSIAWVAAFLTHECPFYVGLPMVFPVPAGMSVDKWIDYSFIASSPINDIYMAVYTDTHIQIKAEKETAVITPVTDCVNATVVEPNVQYTILPGTHWYKFSAEPFINTTDTHARLSFANKSGKTAHVTTGATVGCEYGILTRGKLPIPQMDVDVNVPLWVFGLMSKFVDEDVDQYYLEVTTDEELGFMIEVAMPCPDPTYVADTTVVYMCPGTDYVNPYTEATIVFAHDTVLVDTVATEDICLFNVHVVNLTAMQAPEAMTDATLNLIGAVPALTQGLLPDTTGTIAAIKTYYTTNDTEAIADVVNVSWTDVTVAVACDATTHALTLVVEDACGETHTATFNFPVLPAPAVAPDTIHEYICFGTEFEDPYTGIKTTIFEETVIIADTLPTSIPCVDSVVVFVITPVMEPVTMTDSILNLINAAPVLTPGYQPDTTGTLTKIWDYYKNNDTDTIADVLSVSWADVTTPVACGADTHTMTLYVMDACGNNTPMNIIFPVVANTTTETETIAACESYTWAQNGITYTTSGTYVDTVAHPVTGCDSVYRELILTINMPTYGDTTATICQSELPYSWHGIVMNVAGDTTAVVGANVNGCDSIVTLHLIVNTPTYGDTTATICRGDLPFTWHGIDMTAAGDTTAVVGPNAAGCDSIVTLHLIVLEPTYGDTTATIYPYQLPYTWRGIVMNAAGDTSTVVGPNVEGCDSIVTLHLVVDPTVVRAEVNIVDTVCAGTDYQGRLTKKTINAVEVWTDSVNVLVAGVPTDSIYNYSVQPYLVVTPIVPADSIIVICGNAINVEPAEALIQAHIDAEPLHATVTSITWEVNINGTWTALTSDAIDGNVTQVTLRYTVHTACEDVTSADIVVTNIQTPTPENDLDMTDVPAYNNYGGRLLTVDIKQIKADFGWDVVAEDVTWYMVVEGGIDQEMGKGFYLAKADGTPLEAGKYYARINHTATEASDCDGILQTVDVVVATTAEAPKLVPTVARPNELIQVLNLNADAVSTISVYSTTGELMHTFQVSNQENATFPAAQLTGYYVVEVLTETEKVSLRYIVK